jgi:ribonucleotide monophosphatase NagD (HAD superfamily)
MPGNQYKNKKSSILWRILGAGSILASVATASSRSPTILGKPHAVMFDTIRSAFPDVDPKRTVMIGDR